MIVLSTVSANRPASNTDSSCRVARRFTTRPLAQAPRGRNLAAQGAVSRGRRLRQITTETGSRSPGDSYLEVGDVSLGRRQRADRSPVVVKMGGTPDVAARGGPPTWVCPKISN